MFSLRKLIFALPLAAVTYGGAQTTPSLPKAFAGWVQAGSGAKPNLTADQQSLLKEFGLKTVQEAQYAQNGRHLDLTVYQFPDYTGAYGAFTFWREPNMNVQKVGDEAATGEDRVVFFRGNILVDAKFDKVNAMTLGQLRTLSAELPVEKNPGHPPTLPKYLPTQDLIATSVHYALGPVGLRLSGSPIDASKINFSFSPEFAIGRYGTSNTTGNGPGMVTLASYPTPKIAGEQQRGLEPTLAQIPVPQGAAPAQVKRSSSILVMTSGAFTADEAKTVLGSVNYDADLTWDEPTKPNPRDNVFGLLGNIIILSGVLVGFMFLIGFFFGGFRLIYYKLNPEKARVHEANQELIRLNLR
jgi:hypothetical protein